MRTRSLAILIGFVLLLQGANVSAASFSDVPEYSPYASAFAYLQKRNIVKGFGDGSARPKAQLSRIEGLVSVLRMREQYAPQVVWFTENLPDLALFEDVNQKEWYAPYVEVGFLEGVVKGTGGGYFQPAAPLTVEQALTMLHRAYAKSANQQEGETQYHFSDRLPNVPDQWFTDVVSEALNRNLIAPQERLNVGKPITRGQFFSILHRLHSIESENLYAYQDPESAIATITPQPINLTNLTNSINPLPPPSTTFGPTPSPALQHEYGSSKEFAISIPNLQLNDVAITHPNDPFSKEGILAPLQQGLGHLFAYPGNIGKTMIYGHSSGYPWDVSEYTKVFRTINKLVSGDRVYITYEGSLHVYEVTHKQVIDAKDVSPFNDDGTNEELILYTCWPPDSIKQRYLVHATPVETVAVR